MQGDCPTEIQSRRCILPSTAAPTCRLRRHPVLRWWLLETCTDSFTTC